MSWLLQAVRSWLLITVSTCAQAKGQYFIARLVHIWTRTDSTMGVQSWRIDHTLMKCNNKWLKVCLLVRYCWVRVCYWCMDMCLESTAGRDGEAYLICICVVWYRAGIYSCHKQYMHWEPLSFPLPSVMAGHCWLEAWESLKQSVPCCDFKRFPLRIKTNKWKKPNKQKTHWHYQVFVLLFPYKMHISYLASLRTEGIFLGTVSRHLVPCQVHAF